MSLSRYASAARDVGEALTALLRDEEYEPCLHLLTEDAEVDLAVFVRDNNALVKKLATASPAQQKKILNKLSLEQRFWTIAGAAQMAYEAFAVLSKADIYLQPSGSYRNMIGDVQSVLIAPYECPQYEWPFPFPKQDGRA